MSTPEQITKRRLKVLAIITGITVLIVIGLFAGTTILSLNAPVEAASTPAKQGYIETFEAPDGTKVHKYCDAGDAIYVTPAVSNQAGVGGASIAINTSTNACQ